MKCRLYVTREGEVVERWSLPLCDRTYWVDDVEEFVRRLRTRDWRVTVLEKPYEVTWKDPPRKRMVVAEAEKRFSGPTIVIPIPSP